MFIHFHFLKLHTYVSLYKSWKQFLLGLWYFGSFFVFFSFEAKQKRQKNENLIPFLFSFFLLYFFNIIPETTLTVNTSLSTPYFLTKLAAFLLTIHLNLWVLICTSTLVSECFVLIYFFIFFALFILAIVMYLPVGKRRMITLWPCFSCWCMRIIDY